MSIEWKLAGVNTDRLRFNRSHAFTDEHMASSGDYRKPVVGEQGRPVASLLCQCEVTSQYKVGTKPRETLMATPFTRVLCTRLDSGSVSMGLCNIFSFLLRYCPLSLRLFYDILLIQAPSNRSAGARRVLEAM